MNFTVAAMVAIAIGSASNCNECPVQVVQDPPVRLVSDILRPSPEALERSRLLNLARKEAQAFLDSEHYEKAEIRAKAALCGEPSDLFLERIIGEALIRRGLFHEAAPIYERLTAALHDKAAVARHGYLLSLSGQSAKSRKLWSEKQMDLAVLRGYEDVPPDTTKDSSLLGAWLIAMGDTTFGKTKDDWSLNYYRQALAHQPQSGLLHLKIAKILMRRKERQDALKHFRLAEAHSQRAVKERAKFEITKLETMLGIKSGSRQNSM